jgi:hypothetical protein
MKPIEISASFGTALVVDRVFPEYETAWRFGLETYATDSRYYDLIHRTLGEQFEHRYLVLLDKERMVRVVQPFLVVHQDLLTGTPLALRKIVDRIRARIPSFMKLRMLMIGNSAGEGDLARDLQTGTTEWTARGLQEVLLPISKKLKTALIVFKDFPKSYRATLDPTKKAGFTRVPSMPATGLDLSFKDFDDYMSSKLSHSMRKNLRRKFKKADSGDPITVEAVTDITPYIDEVFPLYHSVFSRSELKFEELNKDYFIQLGQEMPDKARFLIWRQSNKIVGFASLLCDKGVIKDNYIGLDYSVALDYHLYFVTWRDTVAWAIRNGYHNYHSAPLNYDPKLHFRMHLEPLDIYARATAGWLNLFLGKFLPLLEPTRYDRSVRQFPNAAEL